MEQTTSTPFLIRSQPKCKPAKVHPLGPVSLLGLRTRHGQEATGGSTGDPKAAALENLNPAKMMASP